MMPMQAVNRSYQPVVPAKAGTQVSDDTASIEL